MPVENEHDKHAALVRIAKAILLENAADLPGAARVVVSLADIAQYLKDMTSQELAATLRAWAERSP